MKCAFEVEQTNKMRYAEAIKDDNPNQEPVWIGGEVHREDARGSVSDMTR